MNDAALLVNLGTPDKPETKEVRRYLAQFLMDKYVLDVPWLLRALIVYGLILPKRPKDSAEAYASIWTEEGSPLLLYSQKFMTKLNAASSMPMALGMRYGSPSISDGIKALLKEVPQLETLYLVPLYPHYAMSSFMTVVEETKAKLSKISPKTSLKIKSPFYKQVDYIACMVETLKTTITPKTDHILFSYHGVPERQIKKLDPSGSHCLSNPTCCETASSAHAVCYRHHCFETTKAVMAEMGSAISHSNAFQSRLGRDPWLLPNTENILEELAKAGKKNILVICPSFVSDCLETLEEIADRGKEIFEEYGGKDLTLVPCLNDSDTWVSTVAQWIDQKSGFYEEPLIRT